MTTETKTADGKGQPAKKPEGIAPEMPQKIASKDWTKNTEKSPDDLE
jgi:hypothetical protein